MPSSLIFISRIELEEHFDKHGEKLGIDDVEGYLLAAQEFWAEPKKESQKEGTRPIDRARVRWDYQTQEFSIVTAAGFILTYYLLDPFVHGKPTNRMYFEWECNRRR